MCGIIGVTTSKRDNVVDVIIEGLRRLEYRGYDSVGIAVIDEQGTIVAKKAAGTIDSFVRKTDLSSIKGRTGIGHTRWATHGPPTDYNAHPHTDCNGRVAVVHNGVIRNFSSLRQQLIEKGHHVRSETDTELIAHLLEEELRRTTSGVEALSRVLHEIQGTYALGILVAGEPDKIYFARMRSPLIVGIGDGENAIASDIPAIISLTRRVLVLEDGEFGYITPNRVEIYRLTHGGYMRVPQDLVVSRVKTIEWTPEAASKSGYPHFMIKEIFEQPEALYATLSGSAEDPLIREAARMILGAEKVVIVGAGTSYHAGLVLEYFLAKLAGVVSYPLIASEYKLLEDAIGRDTVVVAVSQSGETFDTLEAVRAFKERGASIIGVTNVVGSALSREADLTLYTRAGPEIGVAATKTYLTQVLLLELLAIFAAEIGGRYDSSTTRDYLDVLSKAPITAKDSIEVGDPEAKILARRLVKPSMYIIGRGLGAMLAREAALKIKEIAYLHAEAYPAGESKHGPIALVEEGFPVFVIATRDSPEVAGNAVEMRARGAWVRVVKPANYELELPSDVEVQATPPVESHLLEPFSIIPFFQLLAYHTAVSRGYDPDKPRNLAKTVTVE